MPLGRAVSDSQTPLTRNVAQLDKQRQRWETEKHKPIASWRGGPDTKIGKVIASMIERLRNSPNITLRIDGDNPETLLRRAILENKFISNEQLLAMFETPIDKIVLPDDKLAEVLKEVPNARELPVHKFAVLLMSAVTGISEAELSQRCPDLGLTGAPDTGILYAATSYSVQKSTALHDLTETFREAGIAGVNTAVWGVEGKKASAAVSYIGGGNY